jgi:hypothetical protein
LTHSEKVRCSHCVMQNTERIERLVPKWARDERSHLAGLTEGTAKNVVEYIVHRFAEEIRLGVAVGWEDGEELPINRLVKQMFDESGKGCYFCDQEFDPDSDPRSSAVCGAADAGRLNLWTNNPLYFVLLKAGLYRSIL